MIEPIHIATMGELQLRFFRRPINDGKPDFPWHSVDDLYSCLGLNREQRRVFLRKLKEFGGTQAVATADGIVTIAPLYMAQGCIDAMVEEGRVPDSARTAYALAETEAMKKLMAHLAFGTDAWFGWMKAAVNSPRMTGGSEMFGLGSRYDRAPRHAQIPRAHRGSARNPQQAI